MKIFPSVPEPSSLLCVDDMSRRANTLKEECRRIKQTRIHRPIELICQDAKELGEDRAGCAVLFVHLSEIYWKEGQLGPALRLAEKAEQVFCSWPQNRLKHNHAVALYALGLLHQLLGSDRKALDFYERALEAFQIAKGNWTERREMDWRDECENAEQWIKRLMDYVAATRALGGSSSIQFSSLVGCWSLDSDLTTDDRPVLDVTIESVQLGMHLRLGNKIFRLKPFGDDRSSEVQFRLNVEHLLFKIPTDLHETFPEFENAHYALVESNCQYLEPDLVATAKGDEGILWGKFSRDAEGKIEFNVAYPEDALLPPRIIGSEDLKTRKTGCVVGVFEQAA